METLRSIGVGVLASAITYAVDPSPPWWWVGSVVTTVLIVNPCTRRH
ncbi:hypothetical protein [Streptomyces sp. NPDC047070]